MVILLILTFTTRLDNMVNPGTCIPNIYIQVLKTEVEHIQGRYSARKCFVMRCVVGGRLEVYPDGVMMNG
jgi:hypothetical protein